MSSLLLFPIKSDISFCHSGTVAYYTPSKRPCLIPGSVEVDGLKVLFAVVGSDI